MPNDIPEELISSYTVVWDGVQYVIRLGVIKRAIKGRIQYSDASLERFAERAGVSRQTLWRLLTGVAVSAESVTRIIEAAGLTREEVEARPPDPPAFVLLAAPLREETPPVLRPHLWRDLLLSASALLALGVSAFLDSRVLHGRVTTDGLSFPFYCLAAFFLTGPMLYATVAGALLLHLVAGLAGVPWTTVAFHSAELLVVGYLIPRLKRAEAHWRAQELAAALNGRE
jgi:transcriptional regulator with XRE-family HTH domain